MIARWKLVTRMRKTKKFDRIPENVKMVEEKEENWSSIALSAKFQTKLGIAGGERSAQHSRAQGGPTSHTSPTSDTRSQICVSPLFHSISIRDHPLPPLHHLCTTSSSSSSFVDTMMIYDDIMMVHDIMMLI